MERRELPMHVGTLGVFKAPEGENKAEFLAGLSECARNTDTLLPPFGNRLRTGRAGLAGKVHWERDPHLDLNYHVRHYALPRPGRYRELFELVSRLHGKLLDRSRPLWEMHLIDGLPGREFAVYTKTHHSGVDGARAVHVARSMLSTDQNEVADESPFSLSSWERYRVGIEADLDSEVDAAGEKSISDILKQHFDSNANILQAVKELAQRWSGGGGELMLPHLDVPTTMWNAKVSDSRRFVAQSWEFERIKRVAAAYGGTFNDAVLAMCAGALRSYLIDHGELPEKSLKAMVPMSLRTSNDVDSSNVMASIGADLATNEPDPAKRFSTIQHSVEVGKKHYRGLKPKEVQLVSGIMQVPSIVLMQMGLISKIPMYNLVISNVPGMRETRYWNGAEMTGNYPASILFDGMALNITLMTYAGKVDFGITACRKAVPQVQRLIDTMEKSLQELEQAADLSSG